MKRDSEYFKAVGQVVSCVEKNAHLGLSGEEQDQVCKTQVRNLRLAAFNNELLYHNINKRFYMAMLPSKRGETPY